MFKRPISWIVIITFAFSVIGPYKPAHADVLNLPIPGTMVNLSPVFEPALIKGLTVHKDNPFLFDFIVDAGHSGLSGDALKTEGDRLVKYFFACLTVPEKDLWVNLSPYEKDRMVPQALGQTALGRDLLAQDYILKQLTASLIYPEKNLGKEFWNRVYTRAQQEYGTTQIPVNTFNKVWILADKASVYENGQTAFVLDGHLKVMLEEDYLALQKHVSLPLEGRVREGINPHSIASSIIRQIILPEIEKEVNTGKNFATLRQIFNSQILAIWYKKNLKEALLTQVYADKNTVKGVNLNDPSVKEKIYQQYLKAYKKGVFNYIKEEETDGQIVPRKYFSGGFGSRIQLDTETSKTPASAAMLSKAFTKVVSLSVFTIALFLNKPIATPVLRAPLNQQVASLWAEAGLENVSASTTDPHVIYIDGNPFDLTQASERDAAIEKELENLLPRPSLEMSSEDSAMLARIIAEISTVAGHVAGMGLLAWGILRSDKEFKNGNNAISLQDKLKWYTEFSKDWRHIAGALIIVATGITLADMHGVNIDNMRLDLLGILTGMKIGGGIAGFERMAKQLVAAVKRALSSPTLENLQQLNDLENFKGNAPRKFFFKYTDWPFFGSLMTLGLLGYAPNPPAFWNPEPLKHFVANIQSTHPVLSLFVPVIPVLAGVAMGASISLIFDRNRADTGGNFPTDAAMVVYRTPIQKQVQQLVQFKTGEEMNSVQAGYLGILLNVRQEAVSIPLEKEVFLVADLMEYPLGSTLLIRSDRSTKSEDWREIYLGRDAQRIEQIIQNLQSQVRKSIQKGKYKINENKLERRIAAAKSQLKQDISQAIRAASLFQSPTAENPDAAMVTLASTHIGNGSRPTTERLMETVKHGMAEKSSTDILNAYSTISKVRIMEASKADALASIENNLPYWFGMRGRTVLLRVDNGPVEEIKRGQIYDVIQSRALAGSEITAFKVAMKPPLGGVVLMWIQNNNPGANSDAVDHAQTTPGGIDLNSSNMSMTVTKDANGGVQVNFDPALIAQIRQEGVHSAVPVIINVRPMSADQLRPLLNLPDH